MLWQLLCGDCYDFHVILRYLSNSMKRSLTRFRWHFIRHPTRRRSLLRPEGFRFLSRSAGWNFAPLDLEVEGKDAI
jgi:hypothetical protein